MLTGLFLNDTITDKIGYDIMLQHRRRTEDISYNVFEKGQHQGMQNYVSPACYFVAKRIADLSSRNVKEWNCDTSLESSRCATK